MKTIRKNSFGGNNWYDSHTESEQLLENGSPDIKNIRGVILNDVMDIFPNIDRKNVEEVYDGKFAEFRTADESDEIYFAYDIDGNFGVHAELNFGQNICEYVYEVTEIKDAAFIPTIQKYRGLKYGDTIFIQTHDPFSTYEDAVKFVFGDMNNHEYDRYSIFAYDKNPPD